MARCGLSKKGGDYNSLLYKQSTALGDPNSVGSYPSKKEEVGSIDFFSKTSL